MAGYHLKITHLCVGQGLSVLIELEYENENGQGRFVGLLDCGSLAGGERFWGPALSRIDEAVSKNENVLNYVHISHFDCDHYNLLEKLGARYDKQHGEQISIERMYFGCTGDQDIDQIKESIRNSFVVEEDNLYVLNWVCGMSQNNPYQLARDERAARLFVNIELDEGLFFRICPTLFHPHLWPKRTTGLAFKTLADPGVLINTGSSVLLVTIVEEDEKNIFPRVSYLFTGDATLETMKIMQLKQNLTFCTEKKMIQVAHHGAKRHVADDENNNNYTTLQWLLNTFNPESAVVSAKCKNQSGWTHPHPDTMGVYESYVTGMGQQSFITCFEWEENREKMKIRQYSTTKKLYETFKINEAVWDDTLYQSVGKENYLLYDVVAESDSGNPYVLDTKEILRHPFHKSL